MRAECITPMLVDLAPKPLEAKVLYISQKYRVAVHLCCCGCGEKVVTPLSPAEWQVNIDGGEVTMHPSIGNATPCRSHYWIRRSHIVWDKKMTDRQILEVQSRDRASLHAMHAHRRSKKLPLSARASAALGSFWDWLRGR